MFQADLSESTLTSFCKTFISEIDSPVPRATPSILKPISRKLRAVAFALFCQPFDFVVVDGLRFSADAVGNYLVCSAGKVLLVAVRKMSPMG